MKFKKKKEHISLSLLLSFQSVHLSIWACIFPVCTFCLRILIFILPLPAFIGPWREGSVKPVRTLLIKSSSVSTLPLSVFLPISKVSGGLKADQSRTPPPTPPPPSLIQSDYSCLDAISVSPFVFLISFLLSLFPALLLCARACTSFRPSLCGAPRLSGALR